MTVTLTNNYTVQPIMILSSLRRDNIIITAFINSSFNNFLASTISLQTHLPPPQVTVGEIQFCDLLPSLPSLASVTASPDLSFQQMELCQAPDIVTCELLHIDATVTNCEGRLRRFHFFMNGINFKSGSRVESYLRCAQMVGCWSSYSI